VPKDQQNGVPWADLAEIEKYADLAEIEQYKEIEAW
jgi:hypothetical protein